MGPPTACRPASASTPAWSRWSELRLALDPERGNHGVEPRALPDRIRAVERGVPHESDLVEVTGGTLADRVGVALDELAIARVGRHFLEAGQVAHEHALELGAVVTAVRLARVGEDAASSDQLLHGGIGDGLRLYQRSAVAGGLEHLDQPAQ